MNSPTRPRATGRVTLADVAHAAGVSPMTVSRALRRERAVAPELIVRVDAAIRALGYVPDPAARALATGHSAHVAVLIPLLSNALFVDLLEALQLRLRKAGYQTLIGVTHYDLKEEEQLLKEQLAHRPAGLVVTGFDRSESARQLISRSEIPCVHVMENSDAQDVFSVGLSQTDAGAALTRHLLERGRRRIAFVGAQLDPRVLKRLAGWRRALQCQGLHDPGLEYLDPAPSSQALGSSMFERVVAQDPSVDAIFFCNDDLAQGALFAAARLRVDVPRQIAIAGFNDLTGSDLTLPPLTTVRTPRSEMGSAAAEMLIALMRKEKVEERQLDLGYELVVRQST